MGKKRSELQNISKCLVAVAVAACLWSSGCAGLVAGSSVSAANNTPGPSTPPPTNTPPPSTAQAQLSATPASASFPSVTMGSSNSQTITLQNTGTATATINSASVSGAGFSTSGLTLPLSIAVGQSATFNVVFAPTGAGAATGTISLASNALNSPLAIAVSGSGIATTASLSASTGNLDFGSVAVGNSSSLSVTLMNTGNTNVTISNVLATGAGFTAGGAAANTTLAPTQTAMLNVTFAPLTTGGATGSIAITSNAAAVSIALTGSGGQLSAHTVALNWDASTSDVVGYYVYKVLADGTYARVNSVPVVQTQLTDTNLLSGQTYTYVVTGITADNVESDYSDPVIATIP